MEDKRTVKQKDEGLRLNLEIGTSLAAELEGETEPKKALLVGIEPDAYLIMRLPDSTQWPDRRTTEKQVTVRYMSWGKFYSFQSTVVGYFNEHDLFLVITTYPRTIKNLDSRKDQRFSSCIPATLTLEDRSFTGLLLDISPSGGRLTFGPSTEGKRPVVGVGQKAAFSFQLPGLEEKQLFTCKVQNIRHDGQSLSLGLSFDLESDAAFSLQEIVTFLKEMQMKSAA
ncbi:MAG: flagellar brake protein [Deltaproteobacteria bacterium]|nr:flagellar brake protein [Deltaproteobacteria bacterium]